MALLLFGCAAAAPAEAQREARSMFAGLAPAGVRDLRADYRAALCRRLSTDGCERILRRIAPEAAPVLPADPRGDPTQRYRIAIVPGLFTGCIGDLVVPFGDSVAALQNTGFTVVTHNWAGRHSVAHNAQRLAEHFGADDGDKRPFIVVAYSKGVPDILDMLVRYPRAAQKVAAIISIAGASGGTPLADEWSEFYAQWVAALPLPGCAPGSGDELRDLRRETRREWWRDRGAALPVPLFALVAAPRPEQVSPMAWLPYRRLAQIDPRNDGQLLWQDQIAPRSWLLGFVDADHWAIASPLSRTMPALAFLFNDQAVPRGALILAAIDVVARSLDAK